MSFDFNLKDFDIEEEEEDVEDWESGAVTGRNCIIFLIDATKSMFKVHNEEAGHYFKQCLECCKQAMLDICRKQVNDLVSIVLFGTEKKEGKYALNNIVNLMPLSMPSVSRINTISEYLEDDCKSLIRSFGHGEYAIDSALLYCQRLINASKTKLYIKNIVVFTNNDDPHSSDIKLQHQARKQVEDYLLHEIELEVIGLGEFDSSKFYKELVLTSRGELLKDWEGRDPVKKLSEVKNQIERLTDKFRHRLSMLNLGANFKLQIALHKLYTEPKKFVARTIRTNENEDSQPEADNLGTEEIANAATEAANKTVENGSNFQRNVYPFVGGKHIEITKQELKAAIYKKPRGFEVIGFKKTDEVPLFYSISEPYFLIPFGKDLNNRKVFAELLRKCIHCNLSILCWFSLTKASFPSVYMLHPTEAHNYANGREHSPGFIASKIPFADMVIEPDPVEENGEPTQSQQEAAVEIVKKVTIPFTIDMFGNAERQKRIAMVEALALDYSELPEIEDDTDIDLEEVTNMLGKLNEQFLDCSHLPDEPTSQGTKRGASNFKAGKLPAKIQRVEDPIDMIKQGNGNKLTVAQLRELLKSEGIKSLSAMTKPVLVKIANQRFGGPN